MQGCLLNHKCSRAMQIGNLREVDRRAIVRDALFAGAAAEHELALRAAEAAQTADVAPASAASSAADAGPLDPKKSPTPRLLVSAATRKSERRRAEAEARLAAAARAREEAEREAHQRWAADDNLAAYTCAVWTAVLVRHGVVGGVLRMITLNDARTATLVTAFMRDRAVADPPPYVSPAKPTGLTLRVSTILRTVPPALRRAERAAEAPKPAQAEDPVTKIAEVAPLPTPARERRSSATGGAGLGSAATSPSERLGGSAVAPLLSPSNGLRRGSVISVGARRGSLGDAPPPTGIAAPAQPSPGAPIAAASPESRLPGSVGDGARPGGGGLGSSAGSPGPLLLSPGPGGARRGGVISMGPSSRGK